MTNITDMASIHGKTVTDTKEIGLIQRRRAMVSAITLMVANIKGVG